MKRSERRTPELDLSQCSREPIHIPGSIQPHGVLFAFDEGGRVRQVSANVAEVLGQEPSSLLGGPLPVDLLGEELLERLSRPSPEGTPEPLTPIERSGQTFDVLLHRCGPVRILELERTRLSASEGEVRALEARSLLAGLERFASLPELLDGAVNAVRALTDFERVMVYRFHPDESGEVVAEARSDEVDGYLGLHYPASDIPAQARRLYTLNPLRLIPDATYEPVPILPSVGPEPSEPLDLSFAVLRSVSPVHLEYLANMGVVASMSISIVSRGRLWGLVSCHHRSPHAVPYPVRLVAQLVGRTLGMLVADLETEESERIALRGHRIRLDLTYQARRVGDIPRALTEGPSNAADMVGADGVAVTLGNRIVLQGQTPPREAVVQLVEWLQSNVDEVELATDSIQAFVAGAKQYAEAVSGLLAVGYDRSRGGYVLFFRTERTRTARWAGDPEKAVEETDGEQRLHPRRSFAEWKETVRGRSRPWHPAERDNARALALQLGDLSLRQAADQERTQNLMLGTLGHDLRSPLAAISMATQLLQQQSEGTTESKLHSRIASSSGRMSRMVEQILDVARIRSGAPLALERSPTAIHTLVMNLVDEAETASPGTRFEIELRDRPTVLCDPDRIAQALTNLLSNARHHGRNGAPVRVLVSREGEGGARISICNQGDPIPVERMPSLFEPFQGPQNRRRASGGLGIGLYIVRSIAEAHGGRVEVASGVEEGTRFSLILP